MAIIEAIQKLSNPVLDWLMRIITETGDVLAFIILGVILFWCIDKKTAYKLMTTLLFSAGLNGAIKNFTQKPRPYEEGAKPILQKTEGSSMPSGHSQNITTAATFMVYEYRKVNWVKWTFIALAILVPFSRMYLGQHYLEDVLVGMALGLVIGILGLVLYSRLPDKEEYVGLAFAPALILLMIFIPEHQVFVSGGAYIGLVTGYLLEKKYIGYDTKAPLKIQIFKVLIGLGVTLALYFGLKLLFKLIGEYNILDAIRYFFVAFWASLGAPALFKKIFKQEIET
jgi:undecaprenyl-diphosphatase